MKRSIYFLLTLALAIVYSSCSKPRDVRELLQEKGYKCYSVTHGDSIHLITDKVPDKVFLLFKNEMEIDSLLKSLPQNMSISQENMAKEKLKPVIAARMAIKKETADDDIDELSKINGNSDNLFKYIGPSFIVKMSVYYNKPDYYCVWMNKSRTKILCIYPQREQKFYKDLFDICLRN